MLQDRAKRWPKAQSGVLLKREIEVLSEQAAGIIIAFVILLMRICLARYSIFLIDGSNAKIFPFFPIIRDPNNV